MNIFVKIKRLHDFQFRKVRYYTVHFEREEVNEFFDFLNRMEEIDEVADDLSNLLVWIEEIGENFGAKKLLYFRNESINADVQALPPPRRQMEAMDIRVENLRLYCLVLNEHVVFLFNGGIKTADNAKDCPNVGPYIKQANELVRKIDELLISKEISWNKNQTDIYFDENLEIEL
ncbi:MAG: hypothetical protein WCJ95_21265 [Mariniphaga sp.]